MSNPPQDQKTEKRIGKLLIELGFVTDRQMKEALEVAKKQNIRVGEALSAMGVLDKDQITGFWGPSSI
jgi:hypothetical protein